MIIYERCSNWVGSGLALKLRPGWKGIPRTNALAYYASSSATKGKRFMQLTPGSYQSVRLSTRETVPVHLVLFIVAL